MKMSTQKNSHTLFSVQVTPLRYHHFPPAHSSQCHFMFSLVLPNFLSTLPPIALCVSHVGGLGTFASLAPLGLVLCHEFSWP